MGAHHLHTLLEALSPARLRQLFSLPHARWREDFVPRILATESHEEMLDELARFVAAMEEHWFGHVVQWPQDRARWTAAQLLNETLGDGRTHRAGEQAAMRLCRHGDRGGMRNLLDTLTQALLRRRLTQYLDVVVLDPIHRLPFQDSLDLARRYLELYAVGGTALESPAAIVMRWRQVVHDHAWNVLIS